MKLKMNLILAIALLLGAGVVSVAHITSEPVIRWGHHCDTHVAVRAQNQLRITPQSHCDESENSPQSSWIGWLKGQSRSVSFHFLDLLELLYASHHGAQPTQQPATS